MKTLEPKIKPMTKQELTLAIDRLTRFKLPEEKYNRVFREIIAKYQITPKIGFKDYEKLPPETICTLVENIFDYSVDSLCIKKEPCTLFKKIIELENNAFIVNEHTQKLMQAKIPYESILDINSNETLCLNLEFLKHLIKTPSNAKNIRKRYKTKFPIEKVIIAEGITEEILLPKFAQLLDYDFDKNGVQIVPAGGKNQVAKDYLKFRESLNIPIIILLDADAKSVAETISDKLREMDKLILIEKGEFEDILPLDLIEKAINYKFINLFKTSKNDFSDDVSMVNNLSEIYRINALGEFKKADFAHTIYNVLTSQNDISDEIRQIIDEIR